MFKRFLLLVMGMGLLLNGCAEKNPTKDDGNDAVPVPMSSLSSVAKIGIQGNQVFVLDQDLVNAGVYVYDAATDEWQHGPIAVGLPPKEIAFASKPYIYTTDNSSGYISAIAAGESTAQNNLYTTVGDAGLAAYNGYLYLLERSTLGKIVKLDAGNPTTSAGELVLGSAANPHAAAFYNANKAYVTCYNSTSLVIFNPATMTQIGTIDLSAYKSDSADVPYMSPVFVDSNRLYVVCQRLYRNWSAVDSSVVVVINTTTDQVVQSITLHYANAYNACMYDHKLYIACVGSWMVNDGGIEVINTLTNTRENPVITEQIVGSDITDVAIYSATKGYLIKAGTWPKNYLVRFNPATGQLLN
jgi:hypothetical protein